MMDLSEIAFQVDNLSKIYRIGSEEEKYDNLVGTVTAFLINPVKNYKKFRSLYRFDDINSDEFDNEKNSDTLWALKNISFKVLQGEVIGIIGKNGAGKSTLLKVLSRITEPTIGRVKIYGRVSSLLEVGTGFHPELTGRENVYLNGTILGMKKKEVDAKFDEIVAFSGVEKFLDTPVKRYSSGMQVRLAFSVAAHLDPEILIIDEVLAVGDFEFQKKCINKMEAVGDSGRTVIFVSHNMQAVTRICNRVILLDDGKIIADGSTDHVIKSYLGSADGTMSERKWDDPEKAPKSNLLRLLSARIKDAEGKTQSAMDIRKPVGVEIKYEVTVHGNIFMPYFQFYNEDGIEIFCAVDQEPIWRKQSRQTGIYETTVWIPGNLLAEGAVFVNFGINSMQPMLCQFYLRDQLVFQVIDSLDGDSSRGDYAGHFTGVVRPKLEWDTFLIS